MYKLPKAIKTQLSDLSNPRCFYRALMNANRELKECGNKELTHIWVDIDLMHSMQTQGYDLHMLWLSTLVNKPTFIPIKGLIGVYVASLGSELSFSTQPFIGFPCEAWKRLPSSGLVILPQSAGWLTLKENRI